jgi:hypothetical protein
MPCPARNGTLLRPGAGLIDPTKVVRTALQAAASVGRHARGTGGIGGIDF